MAWAVGVLALYLALARRRAPPALKYAVTARDLLLIRNRVRCARFRMVAAPRVPVPRGVLPRHPPSLF